SFALLVLACGLWAGTALAQVGPTAATPTAFETYSYYDAVGAQPSPSDNAPPVVMQAPEATCAPACDSGCCSSLFDGCGILGRFPCGCCLSDLGEPCRLYKPCCEDSQWSGAGWLAQGYVWNPYHPADRFNGPMTWNDR